MKQASVKVFIRHVHGRDYRNLSGCLLRGHGH